jgi:hypothetical protein
VRTSTASRSALSEGEAEVGCTGAPYCGTPRK